MKRELLLVTLLMVSTCVQAGIGIWSSATLLRVNGSAQYYNTTGPDGNKFGAVNFSGNLGTFTAGSGQLSIGGGGVKTFKNSGGNVCGGTLYYTVYLTGSRPVSPVFTTKNIDYSCDCISNQFACTANSPCGSNDQVWQTATPVYSDITNSLASGNYTLEVYYDITGNQTTNACDPSASTENNGGANFTATFTISSVLPLQLQHFEVRQGNPGTAFLSWSVTDNEEAGRFEIQRLATGTFQTITAVKPKRESGTVSYVHVDPLLEPGVLYAYRLRTILLSGVVKYSYVKHVRVDHQASLVLKGNPVNNELLFILEGNAKPIKAVVINATGQTVRVGMFIPGLTTHSINMQGLPAGNYTLRVDAKGGTSVSFIKK